MLSLMPTVILFLICMMVIYGALSDLAVFRIPNWVSYSLIALFAARAFVIWYTTPFLPSLEFRLPPWAPNAIVAAVVFAVCAVFWKLRYVGGGDVKFLTATSLWMGPTNAVIFFVLLTALALAFVGALKFLRFWDPYFQTSSIIPKFLKQALSKAERNELPYGFPIGLAFIILAPGLFPPA